jgi:hypothetical protein
VRKKRTTVTVSKSTRHAAEQARQEHGFSFSDLVRLALVERPSLEVLQPYLPSPAADATVALNQNQWQQIGSIQQLANQNGQCQSKAVTQADVLRALVDYQLKKLLGGAAPGG